MLPNRQATPTIQRYSLLSQAYIELFGSVEQASIEDRTAIAGWSEELHGPVLDAGCGPGHWTKFMTAPGRIVTGVDLVPEFLAHARQAAPEVTFLEAELSQLPFKNQEFAGILSWYSVIHTPPQALPAILAEFYRVLRTEGQLLLGFFAADELESFDHKVAPAWYWPPATLRALVESVGLEVIAEVTRTSAGIRRHGHLIARKPA